MAIDTFTISFPFKSASSKNGKTPYIKANKEKDDILSKDFDRSFSLPFNKLNNVDKARYALRIYRDKTIQIRCSAASILQGHNFSGSNDAATIIPKVVLAIIKSHGLILDPETIQQIATGNMEIRELHIAGYLPLPDTVTHHQLYERVSDAMRHSHHVDQYLQNKHPTIYIGQRQTFILVLYDKGCDVPKIHHKRWIFEPRTKDWPEYKKQCADFLSRHARIEARYYLKQFQREKILTVADLSKERVKELFFKAIKNNLPPTLAFEISNTTHLLNQIPIPSKRIATQLYLAGHDLANSFDLDNRNHQNQFNSLRKDLLQYGIDISTPAPAVTGKNVVVDFSKAEIRSHKVFRRLTEFRAAQRERADE